MTTHLFSVELHVVVGAFGGCFGSRGFALAVDRHLLGELVRFGDRHPAGRREFILVLVVEVATQTLDFAAVQTVFCFRGHLYFVWRRKEGKKGGEVA